MENLVVPTSWERVLEGNGCCYKTARPGIFVVMQMFCVLTVGMGEYETKRDKIREVHTHNEHI